jgi:glutathione S-transferase
MSRYHIVGRAGAGSLIAEFLFREAGVDYDISFPDPAEVKSLDFYASNPLGRIPVLLCPDGRKIFETLAIINHITTHFTQLAPPVGSPAYDRYSQFMALMATSIYPAYHRQHHSYYYADESAFESLRGKAVAEQALLYDYIEAELAPYICGADLTAADFYLYMLSRWDLNKTAMRANRPKLNALLDELRARPSVIETLAAQPRRKQSG